MSVCVTPSPTTMRVPVFIVMRSVRVSVVVMRSVRVSVVIMRSVRVSVVVMPVAVTTTSLAGASRRRGHRHHAQSVGYRVRVPAAESHECAGSRTGSDASLLVRNPHLDRWLGNPSCGKNRSDRLRVESREMAVDHSLQNHCICPKITHLQEKLAISAGPRDDTSCANHRRAVQPPEMRRFNALNRREGADTLHSCCEALLEVLRRARH